MQMHRPFFCLARLGWLGGWIATGPSPGTERRPVAVPGAGLWRRVRRRGRNGAPLRLPERTCGDSPTAPKLRRPTPKHTSCSKHLRIHLKAPWHPTARQQREKRLVTHDIRKAKANHAQHVRTSLDMRLPSVLIINDLRNRSPGSHCGILILLNPVHLPHKVRPA